MSGIVIYETLSTERSARHAWRYAEYFGHTIREETFRLYRLLCTKIYTKLFKTLTMPLFSRFIYFQDATVVEYDAV